MVGKSYRCPCPSGCCPACLRYRYRKRGRPAPPAVGVNVTLMCSSSFPPTSSRSCRSAEIAGIRARESHRDAGHGFAPSIRQRQRLRRTGASHALIAEVHRARGQRYVRHHGTGPRQARRLRACAIGHRHRARALPAAVGVNVTLIVQLEFAATVVPQLSVSLKSPAFAPAIATLMPVRLVDWPLVRVKVCGELVAAHSLTAEVQAARRQGYAPAAASLDRNRTSSTYM